MDGLRRCEERSDGRRDSAGLKEAAGERLHGYEIHDELILHVE